MGRSRSRSLAAASFALLLSAATAHAEKPEVVASIKPLHSLVAGVMQGVGEPHLLVGGGESPHTYSMRPSDAEALSNADVIFWVGEELETFLERPIANLGADARAVALLHAPGMTLFDFPLDGEEAHADGYSDDDDEHADDHHDQHGDEAHHHAGTDPHVWLDPANARAMVAEIVAVLTEADAENAESYRRNGADLTARLEWLESDTAETLEPFRDVPYFTFHESFRYFGSRFDLDAQGAISLSPDRQPGAQRLREIRAEIGRYDRICIFAEPQFPPKLVDVIVEGTAARTGTLDPLGAALAPGPDLYLDLIRSNRDAFARCFQSTM
ncbi:zinc ABC transporter substrate-binding protein [Microbaculum sp. FT89]|uniref:zinc ABC transporter substrate-binding protein n=1 Tax=Microbaculum sp. FT89 TaxID=3447298 RepID=UPI003F52A32F